VCNVRQLLSTCCTNPVEAGGISDILWCAKFAALRFEFPWNKRAHVDLNGWKIHECVHYVALLYSLFICIREFWYLSKSRVTKIMIIIKACFVFVNIYICNCFLLHNTVTSKCIYHLIDTFATYVTVQKHVVTESYISAFCRFFHICFKIGNDWRSQM
jgi:hypothetical protein